MTDKKESVVAPVADTAKANVSPAPAAVPAKAAAAPAVAPGRKKIKGSLSFVLSYAKRECC